jgi:hypothetical protein
MSVLQDTYDRREDVHGLRRDVEGLLMSKSKHAWAAEYLSATGFDRAALGRRDRAVVTLALECLRRSRSESSLRQAYSVTTVSDGLPFVAGYVARGSGAPWRLLRARLALYLRAVLRADRGDFGEWRCDECGVQCYEDSRYCYREGDGSRALPMEPTRRITPLWELAPEHTGTTSRERREAHRAAE